MTNAALRSRAGLLAAVAASCLLATPALADDAAKTEADSIWKTRCVSCHGDSGKGNGAAAAALQPKPRDFSSAAWQKSVTDDHIAKVIVEGGQAVGLSMMMTGNSDLASKPEVVKALTAHVRGLGGK